MYDITTRIRKIKFQITEACNLRVNNNNTIYVLSQNKSTRFIIRRFIIRGFQAVKSGLIPSQFEEVKSRKVQQE